MKKKAMNVLILFVVLAFGVLVTGTLAYWRIEGQSAGTIETGTLKGMLVQESARVEDLYPGDTVKQSVNVKNTGSSDMLVRLKVDKGWKSERNIPKSKEGLLDEYEKDAENVIHIQFNDGKWLAADDGYYYYLGILKSGETTEEALYDEFEIDKAASNDYQGKSGAISVQMECLQAAAGAVTTWGMTYDDMGLEEPEAKEASQSTVIFGENKQFTFQTEGQDIFPSFKNLVPGESISQIILVSNHSGDNVSLFLIPETDVASGDKNEYLDKLIHQYAKISITDSDGKSLYNGPIVDSQSGEIHLGSIASQQDKKLNVTLQLDPSMENEYQKLAADINWKFVAQGEDGKKTTSTSVLPKTGQNLMWPLLILGLLAAGGGLILIMAYIKKKRDNTGYQC